MADISIHRGELHPGQRRCPGERRRRRHAHPQHAGLPRRGRANTVKQFDASTSAKDTLYGLACEDVATGQPVIIMRSGSCTFGGTLASGDTVWASATGVTKTIGDLTTGWRITVAGVCTGASNAFFLNPTRGGIK
jgi:hypothetical protein